MTKINSKRFFGNIRKHICQFMQDNKYAILTVCVIFTVISFMIFALKKYGAELSTSEIIDATVVGVGRKGVTVQYMGNYAGMETAEIDTNIEYEIGQSVEIEIRNDSFFAYDHITILRQNE